MLQPIGEFLNVINCDEFKLLKFFHFLIDLLGNECVCQAYPLGFFESQRCFDNIILNICNSKLIGV